MDHQRLRFQKKSTFYKNKNDILKVPDFLID